MTRILTIIALLFATPSWAEEEETVFINMNVFFNLEAFENMTEIEKFRLWNYTKKSEFSDRLVEHWSIGHASAFGWSMPKSFAAFEIKNRVGDSVQYVHEGVLAEQIYLIVLVGFDKSAPRAGQVVMVPKKEFYRTRRISSRKARSLVKRFSVSATNAQLTELHRIKVANADRAWNMRDLLEDKRRMAMQEYEKRKREKEAARREFEERKLEQQCIDYGFKPDTDAMLSCKLQVRLSKKQEAENEATLRGLRRAAEANERAANASEKLRKNEERANTKAVIQSLGSKVLSNQNDRRIIPYGEDGCYIVSGCRR